MGQKVRTFYAMHSMLGSCPSHQCLLLSLCWKERFCREKKKETTICSNLRILRNSLRFTIWTIEINVLNWKLNFLDAFLAFLSWCVFKIGKYREVECGLCLLKVWMMEDWRIIAKVYSIFWGNTNVLKLIVVMVAQFCGDIKNY